MPRASLILGFTRSAELPAIYAGDFAHFNSGRDHHIGARLDVPPAPSVPVVYAPDLALVNKSPGILPPNATRRDTHETLEGAAKGGFRLVSQARRQLT